MPISLNKALGNHAQALSLRSQRASLLASNLANADTPNYKARDLDFSAALAQSTKAIHLNVTQKGHISVADNMPNPNIKYRIPTQASLDGNTVDTEVEQMKFAKNAAEYQTSFRFLDGKIKGLLSAIRGE
jgi:flagellar basal-body rod protein FlgB